MKKIIVLYHSGVGVTKVVAEHMYQQLKRQFQVDIYAVEELPKLFSLKSYDGIVIGFPTIHTHPSARILAFMNTITAPKVAIPAYIFTTCGWYAANTLRIFAKECMKKNIISIHSGVYNGCPASDGSLLVPSIKYFFKFHKGTREKIDEDMHYFSELLQCNTIKSNIPRFKLYSILNYPNKKAGHYFTWKIHVHQERCISCHTCIQRCPVQAITYDVNRKLSFDKKKCENCYRCIHHCSKKALSLFKHKKLNRTLVVDNCLKDTL